MELILITIMIVSFVVIVGIDTAQKRSRYLAEGSDQQAKQ